MKAIDNYLKNITKCNNPCLRHMTCLRYDPEAKTNLMQDRNCQMYFQMQIDDSLNQLKNMFGMQ